MAAKAPVSGGSGVLVVAALAAVESGAIPAAVVYSTDATPQVRDQLTIVQVPDPLQTFATYPIAVGKGDNAAGGAAFDGVRIVAEVDSQDRQIV